MQLTEHGFSAFVEFADGGICWSRDNAIGGPPAILTRRSVFSWCGQLVAHLPVCGWLRPAAAWLKRSANSLTQGWDDVTHDAALRDQINFVARQVASDDPARGRWRVSGDYAVVWTDASSIATGVVIESRDGHVIEDACWLRREDTTHINMAKLDAMVCGVNLAIVWGMKTVHLKTDSATVHRWVQDALTGRTRLRTRARGEMLIRRRVDLIRWLREELELDITIQLVPSAHNRADKLTRVPTDWTRSRDAVVTDVPENVSGGFSNQPVSALAQAWTNTCDGESGAITGAAGAASSETVVAATVAQNGALNSDANGDVMQAIARKQQEAGHPGVRRTLYFARRDIARSVTRGIAQSAVAQCQICQSVDPAPVKWRHGNLDVLKTWWRLAIDITHFNGQSYLTVVDCGPSRFSLWRPLRRTDTANVAEELERIFCERGAPVEILGDNDTAFRSRGFAALASRWGVRFRAVYWPSGNSIVERNHRTVKVIAARKQCSVAEALHLYNISPRETESGNKTPASGSEYQVRDCVRASPGTGNYEVMSARRERPSTEGTSTSANYAEGDMVWTRKPGARCTEKSRPGVVTKIASRQVIEVDGTPWHIRDVRRRSLGAEEVPSEVMLHREQQETEEDPPLFITTSRHRMHVPPRSLGSGQNQADDQAAAQVADDEARSSVGFETTDAARLAEPTGAHEDGQDILHVSDTDVSAMPPPQPLRRSARIRQPPDRLTYSRI